ncbi:MAG: hypothetical protein VR73_07565 [Gammaproteobacteria bacterium BRH_c0]|nr:MAG: hypothetical protein VR73_07565 [Gammaproteobacteria bacterium BRH_c0]
MDFPASLVGLFFSGFVSATLLPGGSEALLFYLARDQTADRAALWLAATSGNTLGGMTNWMLGRWLSTATLSRRWGAHHQRGLALLQRWGAPVLLLSWLPVIGDPLTLVAGWLRIHWLPALLLIAIGKGLRYGILLLIMT